jgi:hypothetical protein
MVRFLVRVRDVNGKEYTPPSFTARYASNPAPGQVSVPSFSTISPGLPADLPLVDNAVNLTVGAQAPGFTSETFNVKKIGTRWLADSRAAKVTVQGDTIAVDVVDGTVRLAPTVYIPPDQLVKDNPKKLLCEPGQGWIYYGAYLVNPTVNLLRNPLNFDTNKPVGYPFDPKAIKNEGSGNLVFLEYGFEIGMAPARGPRFLIAVWAPRIPLGPAPQVLVFYTPPTKPADFPVDSYPFLGAYPYSPFMDAVHKSTAANVLVQKYPYLAINYLLAGYKIIPQIQAAGRNPIVIFPVHPTMNWGPLGTQTGMSRLIKEVVRFLYARQIVSSRAAPSARLSLDAGQASISPSSGLFNDEPIPVAWTLTVSGFSNGIDKVLDLCTPRKIDEKLYDPSIFAAPELPLVGSWREIWDIDGVADDGKGAERHLNTLRDWLKLDRRAVRSYHSDEGMRTAPQSLVEASQMALRPTPPFNGIFIEEGTSKDGKVTWAHFSNPSLKPSPYPDAHHTMPWIAFGHAAQFTLP